MERLEAEIAECVSEAASDLRPAGVGFGRVELDLNVNRREVGRMLDVNDLNAPAGLTDREAGMIFIRQEGRSNPSVIVNYAAHPLTMGGASPGVLSADYPGEMAEFLEKEFRSAMFLQGCAGNVNIKISGGREAAKRAGGILAEAVMRAYGGVEWEEFARVEMRTKDVSFPVEALEPLIMINEAKEEKEAAVRKWLERAKKTVRGKKTAAATVQVLKINDGSVVFLPGEQFAETGLEIKRGSGMRDCLVAAYSNCGEIGYVPTAEAFEKGGYEVDSAYLYQAEHVYRNSPHASRVFVNKSLALMRERN